MGHTKRTYTIVESGTNDPPQTNPALRYQGSEIGSSQLIDFNKNTDGMRKVDHYRIKFDIHRFNQSQLRFTPNQADMMWVQKGSNSSSCPTSRIHDLSDTIWVDDWDADGEWIEVINMDMKAEDFWFTLNLVDKSDPTSTTYVALDPGGGNQNGGGPGSGFTFDWVKAIGLGLLAGLVAFFGAGLFLRGW